MARSRRKNKIFGVTTKESEKADKQRCNRIFRREIKEAINQGKEPPHNRNQFLTPWDFAKDGKIYRASATSREMRK